MGVAYAVEKKRQSRNQIRTPAKGAAVRLFVGSHMARCRFEAQEQGRWRLSPPITVGSTAAVLSGHAVKGEVNAPNGVILFRSRVESISPADGGIILAPPEFSMFRDRRIEPRRAYIAAAKLENQDAKIVDISPSGIRLRSRARVRLGDRVRIDLPGSEEPVFGWVLDNENDQVRVRFEEPFGAVNELPLKEAP